MNEKALPKLLLQIKRSLAVAGKLERELLGKEGGGLIVGQAIFDIQEAFLSVLGVPEDSEKFCRDYWTEAIYDAKIKTVKDAEKFIEKIRGTL